MKTTDNAPAIPDLYKEICSEDELTRFMNAMDAEKDPRPFVDAALKFHDLFFIQANFYFKDAENLTLEDDPEEFRIEETFNNIIPAGFNDNFMTERISQFVSHVKDFDVKEIADLLYTLSFSESWWTNTLEYLKQTLKTLTSIPYGDEDEFSKTVNPHKAANRIKRYIDLLNDFNPFDYCRELLIRIYEGKCQDAFGEVKPYKIYKDGDEYDDLEFRFETRMERLRAKYVAGGTSSASSGTTPAAATKELHLTDDQRKRFAGALSVCLQKGYVTVNHDGTMQWFKPYKNNGAGIKFGAFMQYVFETDDTPRSCMANFFGITDTQAHNYTVNFTRSQAKDKQIINISEYDDKKNVNNTK